VARLREKSEAKATAQAADRQKAERSSETLAHERAEAELRATATLQARIAAEEALASGTLEAKAAAQRLVDAHELRAQQERKLAALRPKARKRLAAAVAVAVVLGIAAWLAPRFERQAAPRLAQSATAGPLGLKLDYRLNTLKDK
jgi:hypothetical protein